MDNLIPSTNEFEVLIKEFETEYQKEFYRIVLNGAHDLDEARLQARDNLLPSYPKLEHCYNLHGAYHKEPVEEQPTGAIQGRKIASIMYSTADEFDPDDSEQLELIPVKPEGARWLAKSKPRKITKKPAHTPAGPTKTEALAESIHELEEGYEMLLEYDNIRDAKSEQQLLGYAADINGWNDGKPEHTRSYSSTLNLEQAPNKFIVTVTRLTVPRPTRRYKHHA